MRNCPTWLLTIATGMALGGALTPGQVVAQAVAFTPNIGMVPEGVGMNVTPVVSADRRYVRLSVNAGFSAVDSIQNLNIPLGAVAGGPGAGGGMGGGGFPSYGVPMGMDGPVAGPNLGLMGPYGPQIGYSPYGDSLTDGNAGRMSFTPAPRPIKSKSARSKLVRPRSASPIAKTTRSPTPSQLAR